MSVLSQTKLSFMADKSIVLSLKEQAFAVSALKETRGGLNKTPHRVRSKTISCDLFACLPQKLHLERQRSSKQRLGVKGPRCRLQ